MNKRMKKLLLSKETILNLQHRELQAVAGAATETQLTYCWTECASCPQHSCKGCTIDCTDSCWPCV